MPQPGIPLEHGGLADALHDPNRAGSGGGLLGIAAPAWHREIDRRESSCWRGRSGKVGVWGNAGTEMDLLEGEEICVGSPFVLHRENPPY